MGGRGSGVRKAPNRLPRKRRPGALARLDGRSADVKVVKAGLAAIASDNPGDQAFLFARTAERCMVLDVMCCRVEADFAQGKAIDVPSYLSLVGAWNKLATAIGLARTAKRANYRDYIAAKQASPRSAAIEPSAPSRASAKARSPERPLTGGGDQKP